MMAATLLVLLIQFSLMSLMAFGGAGAVITEIYRQSVVIHQWVSPEDFSGLYAIARTIPGPNVLFVTLIGFKAAGIAGGFVSTFAMIVPSSLLTFSLASYWSRFEKAVWKQAFLTGVSSVVIGFICASTYFLIKTTALSSAHAVIIVACALINFFANKINPLWLIAAGAVIGFVFF